MKKFLVLVALLLAFVTAVPSLAANAADKSSAMSEAAVRSMAINRNFGDDAIAIFRAEYLHEKSAATAENVDALLVAGAIYYGNLRLQLDPPAPVRNELVRIDNLLLAERVSASDPSSVSFLINLREAAYTIASELYD